MAPSMSSEGSSAVGFIADMPSLTDHDRSIIVRARELAEARPGADIMALAEALGRAQQLLGDLAVIAERLDGAR